MNRKQILKTCFLFDGVSGEEFERIFKVLPDSTHISRGELVYSTKETHRSLGLVLSGELIVYRIGSDGKREKCNHLKPGDAVGVASLYGGNEFVSDVEAKKDSQVLFLEEDFLTKLWSENQKIALNYITFLSNRIRFLNQSMNRVRGSVNEQKVFQVLKSYADEKGLVKLPFSMSELASRLNIGRSSLYRAIDTLESTNQIQKLGRNFQILEG